MRECAEGVEAFRGDSLMPLFSKIQSMSGPRWSGATDSRQLRQLGGMAASYDRSGSERPAGILPAERARLAGMKGGMVDISEETRRRGLPTRVVQFRVLLAQYGLYALTNVVLLTINALTTPGDWWFLWVVWGWGVVFAAHAGYFVRGAVGAHVLTYVVAGAGLIVIHVVYSDQRWFYWVLLPWAGLLTLHVLFSSGLRRRYFEWEETLASPESEREPRR